jgi:hypothetical protein
MPDVKRRRTLHYFSRQRPEFPSESEDSNGRAQTTSLARSLVTTPKNEKPPSALRTQQFGSTLEGWTDIETESESSEAQKARGTKEDCSDFYLLFSSARKSRDSF